MDERKKNDRRTLEQILTIWSLAFIWCWICGIVVPALFWFGDLGFMFWVGNTQWEAALYRAPRSLLASAILTPIIGICVSLAPRKRAAMIMLLGGVIPHLLLNGLLALLLAVSEWSGAR